MRSSGWPRSSTGVWLWWRWRRALRRCSHTHPPSDASDILVNTNSICPTSHQLDSYQLDGNFDINLHNNLKPTILPTCQQPDELPEPHMLSACSRITRMNTSSIMHLIPTPSQLGSKLHNLSPTASNLNMCTQAVVTREGPLSNLTGFIADPGHNNITRYL